MESVKFLYHRRASGLFVKYLVLLGNGEGILNLHFYKTYVGYMMMLNSDGVTKQG